MPRAYSKSGSIEKYEQGILSTSWSDSSITTQITPDTNGNYSFPDSISNYTYSKGATSGDLVATTNYHGVLCKGYYNSNIITTLYVKYDITVGSEYSNTLFNGDQNKILFKFYSNDIIGKNVRTNYPYNIGPYIGISQANGRNLDEFIVNNNSFCGYEEALGDSSSSTKEMHQLYQEIKIKSINVNIDGTIYTKLISPSSDNNINIQMDLCPNKINDKYIITSDNIDIGLYIKDLSESMVTIETYTYENKKYVKQSLSFKFTDYKVCQNFNIYNNSINYDEINDEDGTLIEILDGHNDQTSKKYNIDANIGNNLSMEEYHQINLIKILSCYYDANISSIFKDKNNYIWYMESYIGAFDVLLFGKNDNNENIIMDVKFDINYYGTQNN